MKTRSRVENLSLLPLGNNILIYNSSDNYKVFISSNPEARIIRNNFAELPELDNGRWIEYLSLNENTGENGKTYLLAKDEVISEFVTERINKFVDPLYQRMEEEKQYKYDQMNDLVVETKANWKGFIQKTHNN
ncbi:hypothetical protein [uncultured Methanospirillum sp.]|uniref:hypothetical protein n=1 Tax=uncultured Methanospirillum sp. TaxID=262503 RepID=UPI0029C6ABC7|nr:hypothetical protein [uncultured Methanospirillum sp.]